MPHNGSLTALAPRLMEIGALPTHRKEVKPTRTETMATDKESKIEQIIRNEIADAILKGRDFSAGIESAAQVIAAAEQVRASERNLLLDAARVVIKEWSKSAAVGEPLTDALVRLRELISVD